MSDASGGLRCYLEIFPLLVWGVSRCANICRLRARAVPNDAKLQQSGSENLVRAQILLGLSAVERRPCRQVGKEIRRHPSQEHF